MEAHRSAYLAFAACLGAGLALLAYRFGVQPLVWSSRYARVFEIGAAAIVVAGSQPLRGRDRKWPIVAMLPVLLIGAAVTFVAAYLLVPPPSRASLTPRQLPGFAISLPSGDVKEERLDYMAGRVELVDVADSGGAIEVQWEPGGITSREDLELLARGMAGAIGDNAPGVITKVPGPGGAQIETIEYASSKGPVWISMVVCGGRRISLMTGGSSIEALHRRMLPTLVCRPDPSRERSLDDLPLAIDLPAAWSSVKGEAGQVELTDGANALILKPMSSLPTNDDEMPQLLTGLFQAMGVRVAIGAKRDGRFPISGVIEGQNIVGWVWPFSCSRGAVMVLGISTDEPGADRLAELLRAKSHCAGPNEVVRFPKSGQ
jgi:hypothetical protein